MRTLALPSLKCSPGTGPPPAPSPPHAGEGPSSNRRIHAMPDIGGQPLPRRVSVIVQLSAPRTRRAARQSRGARGIRGPRRTSTFGTGRRQTVAQSLCLVRKARRFARLRKSSVVVKIAHKPRLTRSELGIHLISVNGNSAATATFRKCCKKSQNWQHPTVSDTRRPGLGHLGSDSGYAPDQDGRLAAAFWVSGIRPRCVTQPGKPTSPIADAGCAGRPV